MIIIEHKITGVSISGHAGYAESGKDIVCAGISTLAQTLIQSIEELTTDKIQYVISPGTVDIKYGNLSEQARLLIDSFFIGAELISAAYPDFVRVLSKH